MAIAMRSNGLADGLTANERSGAPVLIFEVDADAVAGGTRARARSAIRSLGSIRTGDTTGRRPLAPDEEVTAVLVLRSMTAARLLSCVRALTRGGPEAPPELARQIKPAGREDLVHRQLSHREHEVLRLIADGETTAGIATKLCYSERTVKNVVHDLLEKLNCRTRAQAVALAARQGVI